MTNGKNSLFGEDLHIKLGEKYWNFKREGFKSKLRTLWYKIQHRGSCPIILKRKDAEELFVISKRGLRDILIDWIMKTFKRERFTTKHPTFPRSFWDSLGFAEFIVFKRKLRNVIVDVFIKLWKKWLYRNKFWDIWNLEEVKNLRDFKEMRICQLCFTRITCKTDLRTLSEWEKLFSKPQESLRSLDLSSMILCYSCQNKIIKETIPVEAIARYQREVKHLITIFCFIFYLKLLKRPNEPIFTCRYIEGVFKYNFGKARMSRNWCPKFNSRSACKKYREAERDCKPPVSEFF